jgi:hypothetical protein
LDPLPVDISKEFKFEYELIRYIGNSYEGPSKGFQATYKTGTYKVLREILTSIGPSFPFTMLHEDLQQNVSTRLCKRDIQSLQTTCVSYNGLFREPTDAAKLLDDVRESNYKAAENRVKANPKLMFQYVSYKDPNGHYVMTCPLDFTVTENKSDMYHMFYKLVKDNEPLMKIFHRHMDQLNVPADLKQNLFGKNTY